MPPSTAQVTSPPTLLPGLTNIGEPIGNLFTNDMKSPNGQGESWFDWASLVASDLTQVTVPYAEFTSSDGTATVPLKTPNSIVGTIPKDGIACNIKKSLSVTTTTGSNQSDFLVRLAASVGVMAGYDVFQGSISASIASKVNGSSSYSFARGSLDAVIYTLNCTPRALFEYLRSDIRTAIDRVSSVPDARAVIDNLLLSPYCVGDIVLGGSLRYMQATRTSSLSETTEISLAAEAGVENMAGATVSASAQQSYQDSQKNGVYTAEVIGGIEAGYPGDPNGQQNDVYFNRWIQAVADKPVAVSYDTSNQSGLLCIADMIEDAAIQGYFQTAIKDWMDDGKKNHQLPSPVPPVLYYQLLDGAALQCVGKTDAGWSSPTASVFRSNLSPGQIGAGWCWIGQVVQNGTEVTGDRPNPSASALMVMAKDGCDGVLWPIMGSVGQAPLATDPPNFVLGIGWQNFKGPPFTSDYTVYSVPSTMDSDGVEYVPVGCLAGFGAEHRDVKKIADLIFGYALVRKEYCVRATISRRVWSTQQDFYHQDNTKVPEPLSLWELQDPDGHVVGFDISRDPDYRTQPTDGPWVLNLRHPHVCQYTGAD